MARAVVFIVLCLCALLAQRGSTSQCGVISAAQRCNETTCFYSETESGCDGAVGGGASAVVSVPVCDVTTWSWFDVTFGGGVFQLFESPERAAAGYTTVEDALAWERTIREGTLINCTVANSTAFVHKTGDVKKDRSGHDHDDITKTPLFWVPVIIVVLCLCGLTLAIAAIVGVAVFAKQRTAEKF